MKIGSLFTGVGGLDLAVQAVFGGEHAWFSEINPAASKVLAYRFPGVPNLGDITKIDWSTVEPVDVLCGGFPCTDVSAAGKRAGMHGTRSGLWSHMAEAIDVLRPRDVVIENVRGLLNANANRPLESAEDDLGDGADGLVLRAMGAVLGDISDIGGYEAGWVTMAAASVGAPHRRERVFILASNTASEGWQGDSWVRLQHGEPFESVSEDSGWCEQCWVNDGSETCLADPDYGDFPDEPGVALLPTPSTHDKTGPRSPESIARMDKAFANLNDTAVNELSGVALLPKPNASDGSGGGQHPDKREGHSRQLIDYVLLCTPSASDGAGGKTSRSGDRIDEPLLGGQAREMATAWGKYAPAIARWEAVTGIPAPPPTEPNKNGNPRLSAAFSEWLMGWPAGWVTDPAIGISRNDQLRCVGNGVVSLQAAAAIRYLLAVTA